MFDTPCKVFVVPMEVKHGWSRIRLLSRFWATLTSCLYALTKIQMRKHQKEYLQFLAEIGPEAFKILVLTYRNGITTVWKRVAKVPRDNTKAKESILEEDQAKNVSLSLHHSFCLNRELKVKKLASHPRRLQEQREWMRAYEQLKAWEEIVISPNDEEEFTRQIMMASTSGPSSSKNRRCKLSRVLGMDSGILSSEGNGLEFEFEWNLRARKRNCNVQNFVI